MPRQKNAIPSYLLHKVSGRESQARVRINGRDHLLGPYGSEESRIKYGKLISQAAGGLSVDPLAAPTRSNRGTVHETNSTTGLGGSTKRTRFHDLQQVEAGLSVAELLLAFKRHADAYYTKNGKKTAEIDCLNSAMRPVRELFAMLPAQDFSPLNLKAAQRQFVAAGWSRGFVNASTNRIRRIWKWGVGEGLVPVTTWQALQAVPGLKAGHTTAPDHKRREAVSDEHIEAVRAHLLMKRGKRRELYRDWFDLLRATGARPSELIGLTMADIDTRGDVWIADLTDHKNAHRGLSRKLFFGPQSQLILRRCPATGPLFPNKRRTLADRVKAACLAAKIPAFVPYALRHTKATELRDAIGIESAQATLGHAQPSMTARYGSKMDKLAIAAAAACG